MKNITVTISGKQVRIPKEEFWGIYNRLHEEAEKESIRGVTDCFVDDYKVDKRTYNNIVDSIYENMEEGIERCWDDEVYYWWNQAVEDYELEEVGA